MFAGRRSQLAVSGQQLAVSNGRPTSHEPLATIFPPLLPNRGGPPDRFRRRRSESLFGPSGADQQEAQDGCQNGQLWLGVPLRESREMLFGENAIRRPQAAGRRSQFAVAAIYGLQAASPVFWAISPSRRGLTIRKDVFVLLLYIIKWLYAWILPMGGIVLALILLLCYMFRKHSPGRWALAAITAVFYLLSIEPVSNGLIHPLETAYDQPQGADVDGDVIILLGGGSRAGVPDFDGTGQVGSAAANRFLMALRLQKAKDLPILLSGGTILKGDANESEIEKRMLLSLGVPENKIFMDDKSRNTAENAAFSRQICEHQGWKKPILVTSAFHMPRSVRFFTRQGLDVTPYPCDYHTSAATNWSGYSIGL